MVPARVKNAISCNLCVASAALTSASAATDYYQVRGGIPNSQYYLREDRVGNQYMFFIGNSVLAGAGLKNKGLRYSAQMVKGLKKFFPEASIRETRHMQPGGSWFGLFRCSRGQAVFGEVICSGHLAILDFAADDRNAGIERRDQSDRRGCQNLRRGGRGVHRRSDDRLSRAREAQAVRSARPAVPGDE